MSNSIAFFETQFGKQLTKRDLALNRFERAALPYLHGHILDFGCGLGNLSIAAARQGCTVLALDAAPTAIHHLALYAAEEGLAITARLADLRKYELAEDYDVVVAIGLLMFFGEATARRQLAQLQAHVRPGGSAIVNVLIEGTSFLDMFDPIDHYLFQRDELRDAFAGWEIQKAFFDDSPAPGNTLKCFATLIARKPD